MPRRIASGGTHTANFSSEEVEAFKERQRNDLQRRKLTSNTAAMSEHFVQDEGPRAAPMYITQEDPVTHDTRRRIWRNAEDESLEDYGVDEDAY